MKNDLLSDYDKKIDKLNIEIANLKYRLEQIEKLPQICRQLEFKQLFRSEMKDLWDAALAEDRETETDLCPVCFKHKPVNVSICSSCVVKGHIHAS